MKFCSLCGATVIQRIPSGDHVLRYCCTSCGEVHYQNPKVIVGTLPIWDGKVLLCRRAIEPQYGKWTLPAGFMENGETTQQGALRETIEETAATVEIESLFAVLDVAHINQVLMFYKASLLTPNFSPTTESLEVALFDLDDIPWDELAFRSTTTVLELYCQLERNERLFPSIACFQVSILPLSH
jgi:ADP-ribose pyrophosphatase YjhB (NUDIX family)